MRTIITLVPMVLLISGVLALTVGGTLATFSDSEISQDNYIETGSLDLKVNDQDDLPWGTGIGPIFEITEGAICTSYARTASVWNAGEDEAVAYLVIDNLVDPDGLAPVMDTEIWYDGRLVTSGWMSELAGQQIELGYLLANEFRHVTMVLHTTAGSPGARLEWDMQFELLGSWSDSEISQGNYFMVKAELGGTPGFWSSKAAVKLYGKSQLADWFREIVIVLDSEWFEDDLAGGTDDDEVYQKMVAILKEKGAQDYQGAVNQFRGQYLATRLNAKPTPPRLALDTLHNINSIPDASDYFGYEIGTLEQILDTIANNASGDIFVPPPSRAEMLIMKSVCDALNNP
ncbi:hypothetical protein ES703_25608 [subsurface metagenome]